MNRNGVRQKLERRPTGIRIGVRQPCEYARWIRGIREECLDHLILFSEASLRKVVEEYVAHFHRERPHQGLGNKIIEPEFEPPNRAGEIKCRKRLGGLLK